MIDLTVAVLITLYWDCEWEYLRGRRLPEDMWVCIAVADEIKREKFNSDFTAYLEWWRANRAEELAKRDYESPQ
jgi:hypothetical protein